jgi:hypothetical protein
VLHPGEGGVARWRCAVLPALVVTEELAAPVAHVEGRVGEDIVGLEIGVAVVVEGVAGGDLTFNVPDGEVSLSYGRSASYGGLAPRHATMPSRNGIGKKGG